MYVVVSILCAALAFSLGLTAQPPMTQPPVVRVLEAETYKVYCAYRRTTVETWDLEQMKVRYGSDTCLLHTNTSTIGAMKWMARNFPSGTCSCE